MDWFTILILFALVVLVVLEFRNQQEIKRLREAQELLHKRLEDMKYKIPLEHRARVYGSMLIVLRNTTKGLEECGVAFFVSTTKALTVWHNIPKDRKTVQCRVAETSKLVTFDVVGGDEDFDFAVLKVRYGVSHPL
jgi:hypothetical protein